MCVSSSLEIIGRTEIERKLFGLEAGTDLYKLLVNRRTRGGTSLYGLYRYVRPQRVWFFSRFGLK